MRTSDQISGLGRSVRPGQTDSVGHVAGSEWVQKRKFNASAEYLFVIFIRVAQVGGYGVHVLLPELGHLASVVSPGLHKVSCLELLECEADDALARALVVVGAGSTAGLTSEGAGELADSTGLQVDFTGDGGGANVEPVFIQRAVLLVGRGLDVLAVLRGSDGLTVLELLRKGLDEGLRANVTDVGTLSHFVVGHPRET